ncbi:MAG: DUF1015 domain-containing protein [Fimbriimonadaceae bacterium]
MANIRPFRGLRFSKAAGPIADLVAPPYDVISPSERETLASRNEHNVVHLTLPESKPDDRSKFVKYMRSASLLADWRRSEAMVPESSPALYRYTQTFTIPGSTTPIVRQSLIALIKTEPYSKGIVLPHEQTFPKHKEDRLRILEATRSHLECIYGLFEDEGGQIFDQIEQATVGEGIDVTTDDGVRHVLEPITDPNACGSLVQAIAPKKVWIADGHHRYETAVTFREAQGERSDIIAEDFMMMALSSMSDPGLVLLPTHRIVNQMPIQGPALEDALQKFFNTQSLPNSELLGKLEAMNAPDTRVFGIALPGGTGILATLDQPEDALDWIASDDSPKLKLLDVSILHDVIFEKILGLTGLDFFSYTRDPDEALQAVENGAGASFLMNPPTVEDMRIIALGGEKMPQKSTYYYPKILSGLVVWSLNDF